MCPDGLKMKNVCGAAVSILEVEYVFNPYLAASF